eukprot:1195522-Prorocentrum_minimum.AAC.5
MVDYEAPFASLKCFHTGLTPPCSAHRPAQVRDSFSEKYKPETYEYPEFEDEFQRMLASAEQKAIETKRTKQNPKTPEQKTTSNSSSKSTPKDSKTSTPSQKPAAKGDNGAGKDKGSPSAGGSPPTEDKSAGFDLSKLKARGKKDKKTPDATKKTADATRKKAHGTPGNRHNADYIATTPLRLVLTPDDGALDQITDDA